jgi:hypothetical protein
MAEPGEFVASGSISTSTDTAVVAAPGVGRCIYVTWMTIGVTAEIASTTLAVEDGVGGAVLARTLGTVKGSILNINYSTHTRNVYRGRKLTENTALNIETVGASPATYYYDIGYEIR